MLFLMSFLVSCSLITQSDSGTTVEISPKTTKIMNAPALSGASLSQDTANMQSLGWRGVNQSVQTDDRRQVRADARTLRNQRFIAKQDSLVASRDFQFLPINVQELPSGGMQIINNFYYYVGIFNDHVEVHIPTIRGYFAYMDIVNFDTSNVKDYNVVRMPFGWNVAFTAVTSSGVSYIFSINVYTATGEAIMVMLSDGGSVRYVGSLVKNEPIQVGP